ncbi:MAG: cystathionine gamma-synthase [Ignavibacteria bacterium GWA2_55_11]|nr:MAG: cystathionine gamma-synthase [Ignavibacteria bacterium GWA2_55_11]OGU63976.1 MAG: cystathionine gamma-synthase [Ignavibacteria bacterium RIFCSPHIGHO2_02_FULL_56_12]OGU71552.1 MAG: cystathionine gamma-synthase [Ignavibacteria bacterium RIFCSPLOWO2_12_FULL_56_21]OGU72446.1 MAG: cystathionine gamma-synthase [Ignavibacteria bacterium RIFCSPLOWO2_02_FULL_55_14]
MPPRKQGFSTKAVHAAIEPDPSTGTIMTPVHLTSTYVQQELGVNKGYEYARVSNPTRTVLEKNIAALEGGKEGLAFGSGMAAITTIFHLLKSGDHVVLSKNVYGGTYRLGKLVLNQFGLDFEFVDTTDVRNISYAIRPSTKMVFIETPTNPTMEITDLKAVAKIAKANKLVSIVDNTFASPYLQNPLALGIDIVVHSATKYLNGHSDMLGGLVILNDARLIERLRFLQKSIGGILSPFEAWLCLRGIKTLSVRMDRHCANAMEVALFLSRHRKVVKVNYPGLMKHPQHRLAAQQMRGFGGMISFELGNLAKAKAFLKRVRLCALAESLGGVETLISHPATMTHASVPAAERQAIGVTDGLVRMSVGIEDVGDILEDLKLALGGV